MPTLDTADLAGDRHYLRRGTAEFRWANIALVVGGDRQD
jgi:hypothetical protein